MFWGIVLRNGLQYKLIVVRPFHISRAMVPLIHDDMRTLCCPEKLNVGVYLHLLKEKEHPFQICNLTGCEYQVKLDLNFTPGEVIMFSMGSGYCGHDPEVHMTGHFLDEQPSGGTTTRSQCSITVRGPKSRCLGMEVSRTRSRSGDGRRSRSRSYDREGQSQLRTCCEERDGGQQRPRNMGGSCQKLSSGADCCPEEDNAAAYNTPQPCKPHVAIEQPRSCGGCIEVVCDTSAMKKKKKKKRSMSPGRCW